MSALARFCYTRRTAVLWGWLLLLLVLAGATFGLGTSFKTAVELPDSESSTAYTLLAEADGGSGAQDGKIVWRTDGVAVDDATVRRDVAAMLDDVAAQPGVAGVVSPYADEGASQVNAERDTAYATVSVTDDVDLDAIRGVADQLDGATFDVALGGTGFAEDPAPSHGTEAIGIIAAFAILLLMFRSAWAAILPIVTGLVGVGTSVLAVLVLTHVLTLDATSLTMAALIGLGVGIDYALFIVNRHRKALMAGASVPEAVSQAVNTSGRAVVFAGLTVIVALLGMYVVGFSILTGMGQAAAVAVLFTVAAALTLLPALLGKLGHKVLSKRQRAALASGDGVPSSPERLTVSSRWAGLVQRMPAPLAVLALVLLLAIATPATMMRVGNSDASSDPAGSPGRQYVELMATAFGEGVDAELLLVAHTPDAASQQAFSDLADGLPGVANVAAVRVAPVQPGQSISVATVVPKTSAQTEETQNLVSELRDDVIPAASQGTDLQVSVTGETATDLDISDALLGKLPLYLGLVALLGFLLLVVAFRSILVPLVGALTNLLTLAVGLGAITVIFQLGFGSELLGVGTGAPTMYIVPIIIVGVMFGLSMDYQVFLVSRMHEEWVHTQHNARSVRVGVAETGRVIVTAALVMLSVFASFGFSGERIVAAIGIGLAIAVVMDAFVVRLTLVPAIMHLVGRRNWSYPLWADRITPRVSVEGGPVDGTTLHRAPLTDARTSATR
jgi:RND superfamily putative drug exporter